MSMSLSLSCEVIVGFHSVRKADEEALTSACPNSSGAYLDLYPLFYSNGFFTLGLEL